MSETPKPTRLTLRGAVDGSAAILIGNGTLLTAGDEENTRRLYQLGVETPVRTFSLDGHLKAEMKKGEYREADIEGAAQSGDHLYWIGSHGRNKKGKWRPTRRRLLAMELREGVPEFVGYTDKKEGLNIEALARGPGPMQGSGLLIGLRSMVVSLMCWCSRSMSGPRAGHGRASPSGSTRCFSHWSLAPLTPPTSSILRKPEGTLSWL